MFIQSSITKNVLKIFEYLKRHKLIENKTEFCNRIAYELASFDKVQAGLRDFPDEKIHALVRAFYVNVNFILTGNGKMFYIYKPKMKILVKDIAVISVKNKMIIEYTTLENVSSTIEFIMN